MIPFISVTGSPREVGRQVGEATAEVLRRSVDLGDALPGGRSIAGHGTTPSVCRYVVDGDRATTAFWSLADVTAGEIR